jgi:hypothetical protein
MPQKWYIVWDRKAKRPVTELLSKRGAMVIKQALHINEPKRKLSIRKVI